MLEGELKFIDYKDSFYDNFGNRINNYVVGKYCKSGNNNWILEEIIKTKESGYFVIDGKLFFKCNDTLMPLNMDFESKKCGICYKVVGKDTTEYRRVIGNEYLCSNKYLGLRLHKQNYSDCSCFYTLEDNRGKCRAGRDYRNSDLSELIKVLERRIAVEEEYVGTLPILKESIKETRKFVADIQKFI